MLTSDSELMPSGQDGSDPPSAEASPVAEISSPVVPPLPPEEEPWPEPPPYVGEPRTIAIGDTVVVVGEDGKKVMVKVLPGKRKGTHNGEILLDHLIGRTWGDMVTSMKGGHFWLLKPTLEDWVMTLRRQTQIIYPKDLGPILLKLGVRYGDRVLECGCGSGGLTTTLAWAVGPTGQVYSYDRSRAHMLKAKENIERTGMGAQVTFRLRDPAIDGFVDRGMDAVFLDAKDVPALIPGAAEALAPGHMLGILVPTYNQVSDVIVALAQGPFMDVEIQETFYRQFKVNPTRLRPEDRMVGHTGFLIFARRISVPEGVTALPNGVEITAEVGDV